MITATIAPPTTTNSTLPVFSGFIAIRSNNETQRVAYLGVHGSLHALHTIDTSTVAFNIAFPAILDSDGNPQNGTTSYNSTNPPTLALRCVFHLYTIRLLT